MKTLVESIKNDDRWCPQYVNKYKSAINIMGDYHDVANLKSNFSYTMQYIEYLEQQIRGFDFHNVVFKMTCKSYVINAMSVIEMLFSHIIKKTNNWPTDTWKKNVEFKANPKKLNKERVQIKTIIYNEVEKFDKRLDFDSMIKKVEGKKLITVGHDVFANLKWLRQKRNRVHIQQGEHSTDTDFNNFGLDELLKVRKTLYDILLSTELCKEASTFGFLNEDIETNG